MLLQRGRYIVVLLTKKNGLKPPLAAMRGIAAARASNKTVPCCWRRRTGSTLSHRGCARLHWSGTTVFMLLDYSKCPPSIESTRSIRRTRHCATQNATNVCHATLTAQHPPGREQTRLTYSTNTIKKTPEL